MLVLYIECVKGEIPMEIRPVKKYRTPVYPSLIEAQNHPELLEKLPKRWQNNRAVMASLIALTMIGTSGCTKDSEKQPTASESSGNTSQTSVVHMAAPIFYHGEGTGSLGCEMVAPPVFLSEAEALAIIKNEAASAGIQLDDSPDAYSAQPGTTENPFNKKQVTLGEAVPLDLYDTDHNVAVSFVSMNESEVPTNASVQEYNSKLRAEQAAESWKEESVPYVVGTFYDPGVGSDFINNNIKDLNRSNEAWEEKKSAYETKAKSQLEKELRAQVKDFIGWLKGQGVI